MLIILLQIRICTLVPLKCLEPLLDCPRLGSFSFVLAQQAQVKWMETREAGENACHDPCTYSWSKFRKKNIRNPFSEFLISMRNHSGVFLFSSLPESFWVQHPSFLLGFDLLFGLHQGRALSFSMEAKLFSWKSPSLCQEQL